MILPPAAECHGGGLERLTPHGPAHREEEKHRENCMRFAEHLGDGAYVHWDERGVVLTANHHDPAQATDTVVLDGHAVTRLQAWLETVEGKLVEEQKARAK